MRISELLDLLQLSLCDLLLTTTLHTLDSSLFKLSKTEIQTRREWGTKSNTLYTLKLRMHLHAINRCIYGARIDFSEGSKMIICDQMRVNDSSD